jgi:hypothetical protein
MSSLMRTTVSISLQNSAWNMVSILQVFGHKRACCYLQLYGAGSSHNQQTPQTSRNTKVHYSLQKIPIKGPIIYNMNQVDFVTRTSWIFTLILSFIYIYSVQISHTFLTKFSHTLLHLSHACYISRHSQCLLFFTSYCSLTSASNRNG